MGGEDTDLIVPILGDKDLTLRIDRVPVRHAKSGGGTGEGVDGLDVAVSAAAVFGDGVCNVVGRPDLAVRVDEDLLRFVKPGFFALDGFFRSQVAAVFDRKTLYRKSVFVGDEDRFLRARICRRPTQHQGRDRRSPYRQARATPQPLYLNFTSAHLAESCQISSRSATSRLRRGERACLFVGHKYRQ